MSVFSGTSLAPAAVSERQRSFPIEERVTRAVHVASIVGVMASTITVRSPYDDSVIGEIPAQSADDVADAVAKAKAALKTPLPLWKRAAILDKAAQLLTERRDEFRHHHRQGGRQADQDRSQPKPSAPSAPSSSPRRKRASCPAR
jgi:delta 1-pyrroline-5-carboxylate dehydrogenase